MQRGGSSNRPPVSITIARSVPAVDVETRFGAALSQVGRCGARERACADSTSGSTFPTDEQRVAGRPATLARRRQTSAIALRQPALRVLPRLSISWVLSAEQSVEVGEMSSAAIELDDFGMRSLASAPLPSGWVFRPAENRMTSPRSWTRKLIAAPKLNAGKSCPRVARPCRTLRCKHSEPPKVRRLDCRTSRPCILWRGSTPAFAGRRTLRMTRDQSADEVTIEDSANASLRSSGCTRRPRDACAARRRPP